jgi:hypothetical protein
MARRGNRSPAGLAWSTFGPHATGAERFLTVSSGTPFAQVGEAVLGNRPEVQDPDKDEVPAYCSRLGRGRSVAQVVHVRNYSTDMQLPRIAQSMDLHAGESHKLPAKELVIRVAGCYAGIIRRSDLA